jgi:hypothetical protein
VFAVGYMLRFECEWLKLLAGTWQADILKVFGLEIDE